MPLNWEGLQNALQQYGNIMNAKANRSSSMWTNIAGAAERALSARAQRKHEKEMLGEETKAAVEQAKGISTEVTMPEMEKQASLEVQTAKQIDDAVGSLERQWQSEESSKERAGQKELLGIQLEAESTEAEKARAGEVDLLGMQLGAQADEGQKERGLRTWLAMLEDQRYRDQMKQDKYLAEAGIAADKDIARIKAFEKADTDLYNIFIRTLSTIAPTDEATGNIDRAAAVQMKDKLRAAYQESIMGQSDVVPPERVDDMMKLYDANMSIWEALYAGVAPTTGVPSVSLPPRMEELTRGIGGAAGASIGNLGEQATRAAVGQEKTVVPQLVQLYDKIRQAGFSGTADEPTTTSELGLIQDTLQDILAAGESWILDPSKATARRQDEFFRKKSALDALLKKYNLSANPPMRYYTGQ